MRKYIIMGVQGSGKGTQAKLLADVLDLEHISVGDIFRWNVEHHTKLGAQVRRIVASGELVGDDLVEKVVRRRLDEHDWNYGFIVDGFPRNQPQARFFLESYDLDAVILLDLPDDLVERRVLSRRLCSRCGLDYNLISSARPSPTSATSAAAGWSPGPTTPPRRSGPGCATTTPRPGRCWSCSGPRRSCSRSTRQPAADVQAEIRKRSASARWRPSSRRRFQGVIRPGGPTGSTCRSRCPAGWASWPSATATTGRDPARGGRQRPRHRRVRRAGRGRRVPGMVGRGPRRLRHLGVGRDPGYLPGPVNPGTWQVVLGPYTVAPQGLAWGPR